MPVVFMRAMHVRTENQGQEVERLSRLSVSVVTGSDTRYTTWVFTKRKTFELGVSRTSTVSAKIMTPPDSISKRCPGQNNRENVHENF